MTTGMKHQIASRNDVIKVMNAGHTRDWRALKFQICNLDQLADFQLRKTLVDEGRDETSLVA